MLRNTYRSEGMREFSDISILLRLQNTYFFTFKDKDFDILLIYSRHFAQ